MPIFHSDDDVVRGTVATEKVYQPVLLEVECVATVAIRFAGTVVRGWRAMTAIWVGLARNPGSKHA